MDYWSIISVKTDTARKVDRLVTVRQCCIVEQLVARLYEKISFYLNFPQAKVKFQSSNAHLLIYLLLYICIYISDHVESFLNTDIGFKSNKRR